MNNQTEMFDMPEKVKSQASTHFGNMHADSGKDEWLTPPEIIKALGSFDLDPCSPIKRPWDTARRHYNIDDDGLTQAWSGRVWLNPPYGNKTFDWIQKLADHGNGIALIFARTETSGFFAQVWKRAEAILFLRGRLSFYNVTGAISKDNAGAPSCLVAYGLNNAEILKKCGLAGHYSPLNSTKEGE